MIILNKKDVYFKNQCLTFCNNKISEFTENNSKEVGDSVI